MPFLSFCCTLVVKGNFACSSPSAALFPGMSHRSASCSIPALMSVGWPLPLTGVITLPVSLLLTPPKRIIHARGKYSRGNVFRVKVFRNKDTLWAYVCSSEDISVSVYFSVYVWRYLWVCVCAYTCRSVSMCVYTSVQFCLHVSMSGIVFLFLKCLKCLYIIWVSACLSVCICVYIYVYVYVCVSRCIVLSMSTFKQCVWMFEAFMCDESRA